MSLERRAQARLARGGQHRIGPPAIFLGPGARHPPPLLQTFHHAADAAAREHAARSQILDAQAVLVGPGKPQQGFKLHVRQAGMRQQIGINAAGYAAVHPQQPAPGGLFQFVEIVVHAASHSGA